MLNQKNIGSNEKITIISKTIEQSFMVYKLLRRNTVKLKEQMNRNCNVGNFNFRQIAKLTKE